MIRHSQPVMTRPVGSVAVIPRASLPAQSAGSPRTSEPVPPGAMSGPVKVRSAVTVCPVPPPGLGNFTSCQVKLSWLTLVKAYLFWIFVVPSNADGNVLA